VFILGFAAALVGCSDHSKTNNGAGPQAPLAKRRAASVKTHVESLESWSIPVGRRQLRQRVVAWELVGGTPRPGNGWSDQRLRFGLTLWTQIDHRWRQQVLIRQPDYPVDGGEAEIRIADVTHDGYPDLLVARWPGMNHICGPRQIFDLGSQRARPIFNADFCETYWKVARGAVAFDEAWYSGNDSMCCPSFRHKFALRWNGHRFVKIRNRFIRTPIPEPRSVTRPGSGRTAAGAGPRPAGGYFAMVSPQTQPAAGS